MTTPASTTKRDLDEAIELMNAAFEKLRHTLHNAVANDDDAILSEVIAAQVSLRFRAACLKSLNPKP